MSIPEEHLTNMVPGVNQPEPPAVPAEPEVSEAEKRLQELTSQVEALKNDVKDRDTKLGKAQEHFLQLINSLPQEGEQARPQAEEPKWDDMTAKDMVQYVIQHVDAVNRNTAQELGKAIIGIKLEGQIERLADRVGWDKFMTVKDAIVEKYREKNGTLTVAEAYTLVTGEKVDTRATPSSEAGKDGERPPQSGANGATGRRPASGGSAKPSPAPKSSREAATQAFTEVFGKAPGR